MESDLGAMPLHPSLPSPRARCSVYLLLNIRYRFGSAVKGDFSDARDYPPTDWEETMHLSYRFDSAGKSRMNPHLAHDELKLLTSAR
jgi:hypothetical protein